MEGDRFALPLVRLRLHRVERIDDGGATVESSTVFCPERRRSVDLDECGACPRLSIVCADAIECAAHCLASTLQADARLGDDIYVGDAIGSIAVVVDADLSVPALVRALEGRGCVAIVVDDAEQLVGLAHKDDAARAVGLRTSAREVARRVTPIHERTSLAEAIDRMVHERARALPVVGDDGCVVALLTDLDALRRVAGRG
jgi:CBS domain-containing protein